MESPTSYALNAGVSDTPIVIVDVTGRCNLKCVHCWNAGFIGNELDSQTVLDIINSAPSDARIHFLGGEPLLHKDLDKFIECSAREGRYTSLVTNGLLADRERILSMAHAGLSELGISIESSDKHIHESIRGRNSFDKAWSAVNNVGEMVSKGLIDIALTISTTAMSINIKSLPDLLLSLNNLGLFVDNVIIDRLVPEGRASDHSRNLSVPENVWLDTAESICENWKNLSNINSLVLKVPPLVHEYLTTKFDIFLRDSIIACPALQVKGGARICSDGSVYSCSREGLIERAKNNGALPYQGKHFKDLIEAGVNPYKLNDFRETLEPLLSSPTSSVCKSCQWREKCIECPLVKLLGRGEEMGAYAHGTSSLCSKAKARWDSLATTQQNFALKISEAEAVLSDDSIFKILSGAYFKTNRDESHACISAKANILLEMPSHFRFDVFWQCAKEHKVWRDIKYNYKIRTTQMEKTAELIGLKMAFEKLAVFEKASYDNSNMEQYA